MNDVTTIVNAALDRMRIERRLNEEGLANALNVDQATIWRWRRGKNLGKSARVLIPLIAQLSHVSEPQSQ